MKKLIRYSCLSIACFFTLIINISAQQVQRQVAISAYIYNFAKNIEWQNESQFKEFNFLIIGDDQKLIQEMQKMAKSKSIRDKKIKISTATTFSNRHNVQLIFLLKDKEEGLVKLFDQIEGKNILLVSDGYPDKRLIMINFFDSGNGTLQFEINKANILNQNLRIMQDMILLGGTEIDVAVLYREGQQSLRTLQKHSDDLEMNLRLLETRQNQLEKTITAQNKEIQISKDSLNRQSLKIQEQQKVLGSQSLLLKEREKELDNQILKIQEQQRIFALQTKDLEEQRSELEKGNKILQEQKEDISKQKVEIDTQSMILAEQGMKIHKQQNLVYLLVIIILLVIVLAFVIYNGYKNKQNLNKRLENRVAERTSDLEASYKQLKTELAERKRAEENLKTTNEELLVINRMITTCTSILDTNEMLEKVLLETLDIVGLEGGAICIIEPGNTIKLIASKNTSEAIITDLTENRIAVGDGLSGDCTQTNCPFILSDRESVLKYSTSEALRKEEIQFHASFPCTIKDKCIGIICAFTRTDNKPTDRNLKLLETLTSQVAMAIENAQLFEKIQGYANELETRVRERTSELEIRTNELARMNKMFVGREIRMAELKAQIEKLERKNDSI